MGFVLANLGYDVWLGNSRGVEYSKDHMFLSTKSKEYWEFSWSEMGDYDLPAMIDLAINKTGVAKVTYVGHSMGTT